MSAIEETKSDLGVRQAPASPSAPALGTRVLNFLLSLLNLVSSVRFGVVLLILLVVACMIGMLVMQQNVEGFDKYYAELTPATKFLFGTLGFFDIYHVWYFNVLLLVLSLNIVLASIDRFPTAWTYISRKKLDATAKWLRGQEQSATVTLDGQSRQSVAERVAAAFGVVKLKTTITEKKGKTYVFGERGAWNRLGAYSVHVALLTIFFGGFLTAMFSRVGNMPLEPGDTAKSMSERIIDRDQFSVADYTLPFDVECTDIQQTLIRKEGSITADNTLDWFTRIKIKERGSGDVLAEAQVHMNNPFDFQGYRFFQASFIGEGRAREIKLLVTPAAGGEPRELTLGRDGAATLADGTRIDFADFQPNFSLGNRQEQADGSFYNNPAAVLGVTPPGGQRQRAFAFPPAVADAAPFAKQPVAGYTYRLLSFEKVPKAHILSVQRDPGAGIVYVGFTLLGLTLCAVFFFSHERVWAQVEERPDGRFEAVLGGNTSRNHLGFGDRFRRIVEAVGGETVEVKKS